MGGLLNLRRRFAMVALVPAGCLVACSAILGIEDKPLRLDAAAAETGLADAMDATDATDAAVEAGCDPLESSGCTAACPHDFCDDFDGDGQAPATRWSPPPGFKNPIVQGDSGVSLTTAGISRPAALLATTGQSGSSTSFAILVNQLVYAERHANQEFDGVRVALDLRVDTLSFTGTGGPVKDAGSSTLLGLLRPDSFPPKGIAIVLTGRSVVLDVSEDVFDDTGNEILADINPDLKISTLLDNWVRVELFVGQQARAVREGYDRCGTLGPGLVAAATLGGKLLGQACVAVPVAFGPATWPETPALLVGSLLFAPGKAVFGLDNVVADFYVK